MMLPQNLFNLLKCYTISNNLELVHFIERHICVFPSVDMTF